MEGMIKLFDSFKAKLKPHKYGAIIDLPDADCSLVAEAFTVDRMVLFGDKFSIKYKLVDNKWVVDNDLDKNTQ